MYRAIADAPSPDTPNQQTILTDAVGDGLARGGKREDSARLYRYARHSPNVLHRQTALIALARIFGIPLAPPQPAEYSGARDQEWAVWEERAQKLVRDAIDNAGKTTAALAPPVAGR